MVIALTVIFILNIHDIVNGKIDSFNYMIRNTHNELSKVRKVHNKVRLEQVLAFAMDNMTLWDEGILKVSAVLLKNGEKTMADTKVYNCTKFARERMSEQVLEIIPPTVDIKCLNISTKELKSGVVPQINFSECTDAKKCKDLKVRNKLLADFNIYAFTLADASDFTSTSTHLKNKFAAEVVSLSKNYKKRSTLILREMDIDIYHGWIITRKRSLSTNMYLRNEEQLLSTKTEKTLLELRLEIDKNSEVFITKSFQSLSHLLSFVGGFSQGISLLLLICVFPVREVLYYKKLINEMFNVCVNEEQFDLAIEMISRENTKDTEGGGDTGDDGGDDPDDPDEKGPEVDIKGDAKDDPVVEKPPARSGFFGRRKKTRKRSKLTKVKRLELLLKKRDADADKRRGLMDEIVENLTPAS
jgi:hypothetical protein